MTPYREQQEAQYRKFKAWQEAQGGRELPVQLSTYLKPHQQHRVRWLQEAVIHPARILEVGCNWGYVLAQVGGQVGLDRSPMALDVARFLNASLEFVEGEATQLPFEDQSFDTVLLPEVLEHLEWPDQVRQALTEGFRVARRQVLATLPNAGDDEHDEAGSPKHPWLPTVGQLLALEKWFPERPLHISFIPGFICLRWIF